MGMFAPSPRDRREPRQPRRERELRNREAERLAALGVVIDGCDCEDDD